MDENLKENYIAIDTNYILEILNGLDLNMDIDTKLNGKFTKTNDYTRKLFKAINNNLEYLNQIKQFTKSYIDDFLNIPKIKNNNFNINLDYVTGVINSNNQNVLVLSSPDNKSEILNTLQNGNNVKVLGFEDNNNYVKIITKDNKIGYISTSNISLSKNNKLNFISNRNNISNVNYSNYNNSIQSSKYQNTDIVDNNLVMQHISNKQVEAEVNNALEKRNEMNKNKKGKKNKQDKESK